VSVESAGRPQQTQAAQGPEQVQADAPPAGGGEAPTAEGSPNAVRTARAPSTGFSVSALQSRLEQAATGGAGAARDPQIDAEGLDRAADETRQRGGWGGGSSGEGRVGGEGLPDPQQFTNFMRAHPNIAATAARSTPAEAQARWAAEQQTQLRGALDQARSIPAPPTAADQIRRLGPPPESVGHAIERQHDAAIDDHLSLRAAGQEGAIEVGAHVARLGHEGGPLVGGLVETVSAAGHILSDGDERIRVAQRASEYDRQMQPLVEQQRRGPGDGQNDANAFLNAVRSNPYDPNLHARIDWSRMRSDGDYHRAVTATLDAHRADFGAR
jgi:hypothetical protein